MAHFWDPYWVEPSFLLQASVSQGMGPDEEKTTHVDDSIPSMGLVYLLIYHEDQPNVG